MKQHIIDWSQIQTVLLDMDGTLLDLHFDWHFWMEFVPQSYAKEKQIPVSRAKQIIHKKINAQAGTLNWYCLDYWTDALQLPIAQLKRQLRHNIKVHPEVINFLKALREQGKDVIMVTNAHQDSLAVKLEMTEIGRYFDHLISAHDFGMPKEDIAIWDAIHSVHPYDPARTVLIDDNLHALQTAKDYGIREQLCATFVSPHLDPIDPKGFKHFSNFLEIMP
ncbi:GMP/IMP nucleotidase [Thiomicrorhabdus sediminis]|uniref:GMP/IMP nucleotidase n=1 Tax=Thiomicrorhabdus sediminis TaxID=2580412 RepID=A0A4P9K791_9GAMM|nr:GMP/IMP nucleotidase [Thiomicrorhabdus sediminis]QCU90798.1 GMP/IMP nucleotidase [Thiomicrorhabdus sediminis]